MKNTCITNLFTIVIFVLLFTACYANADVMYVDGSATGGGNNGSSWTNAYLYLQDAITAATSGDQVWVAAGVYTPDTSNANPTGSGDRTASFVLKNLVEIHGGFVGGETSLEERVAGNETFLSGDLLGDDNPAALVQELLTDATRAENSYHVVYGDLCGSPTVLEGVTVTAGQADGADELGKGGGWYNITNSSPTVEKCIFTRNAAQTRGGGWYNDGTNCKPTLTEVTFMTNYCADRGGAVAMLSTGADAELNGCSLVDNYADNYGGSMYLDRSSPTIVDSSFSGDFAIYGGSLAGVDTSGPTITNTSFDNSSATYGGAVWANASHFKFYDCPLSDNEATTNGGACYFSSGLPEIYNSDFNRNLAVTGGAVYQTYSDIIYEDCSFIENNTISGSGGAIYCDWSSPQINRCHFYDNYSASQGGAIYNYVGHPTLIDSKFISNSSGSHGGAISSMPYGYCTSYNKNYLYPAYLTGKNCLFISNSVTGSGTNGGAIANLYYSYRNGWIQATYYIYTYTDFDNCTFYNNIAVDMGGAVYTNHGNSTNAIDNCIFYNNADTSGGNQSESAQIYGGNNTVLYSCIQNLSSYAGNGNIGDDPSFIDPLGPDYIGGTLDDNLRLTAGSPCIDAGNGLLVPADLLTDLDEYARCQDDPATIDTGIPAANPPHDPNGVVDMGAYEFSPICQPVWCDDNLKAEVEEALGITNPTCSEMLNLTSLDVSNKEITCLDGLEYALNLTSLRANNNQVVDVTPISRCTNLQTLSLYSNDIVDISPLCDLVNLTYLHLAYNAITEIPSCLCNLNQIRTLFLYNNPISDICPAICFTMLQTFWIYSIETLPLNAYQVCIPQIKANNPNLTDFRYDTGCVTVLETDVNDDCIVNLIDFAQMCEEWLSCTHMYTEMCP